MHRLVDLQHDRVHVAGKKSGIRILPVSLLRNFFLQKSNFLEPVSALLVSVFSIHANFCGIKIVVCSLF